MVVRHIAMWPLRNAWSPSSQVRFAAIFVLVAMSCHICMASMACGASHPIRLASSDSGATAVAPDQRLIDPLVVGLLEIDGELPCLVLDGLPYLQHLGPRLRRLIRIEARRLEQVG